MTTEQTGEVGSPGTTNGGAQPRGFEPSTFEVMKSRMASDDFCGLSLETIPDSRPAADPLFQSFDGMEVTLEEPLMDPTYLGETEEQLPEDQASVASEENLPASSESESEAPAPSADEEPVLEEAEVSGEIVTDVIEATDATENALERAIAEAREAGIAQGKAEAFAESEERLSGIERRYAEMLDDMRNQIHEAVDAVEQRAVSLAVRIAGKIMNAAVEVNPEYIITIVREAVKVTGGATIRAIRVSPSDFEFISKLPAAKLAKELDSQWKFEPDEGIRVGCVVETVAGTVDYDLDKAWDRIKESVLKIR